MHLVTAKRKMAGELSLTDRAIQQKRSRAFDFSSRRERAKVLHELSAWACVTQISKPCFNNNWTAASLTVCGTLWYGIRLYHLSLTPLHIECTAFKAYVLNLFRHGVPLKTIGLQKNRFAGDESVRPTRNERQPLTLLFIVSIIYNCYQTEACKFSHDGKLAAREIRSDSRCLKVEWCFITGQRR